jgi:protein O-GlcNAc transferase
MAATPLEPALHAQLVAALDHHRRGELDRAESLYRGVLAARPHFYDALYLLGVLAESRGRADEGIGLIRRAIAADPAQPSAHLSLARILISLHEASAAASACEALLRLQPRNPEAWLLRGNALQLGGAHDLAVDSFERALSLKPDFAAACNNQAHSLRMLRRTDRALVALERALALRPGYPMALNNRGLTLLDQDRPHEALIAFDAALAAAAHFPEALSNRGTAFLKLRRFAAAACDFARLARETPILGGVLGNLIWARRNACDWTDHEATAASVMAAVERGECAAPPLSFLCVADSPHALHVCARSFTQERYPPQPLPPADGPRGVNERIRVAYLSGDFGAHAVSYLLAGVVEAHDATRFETTAISWDRQHDGPMRDRLEAAFGRFIDATAMSDSQIARLLRDLNVDIAVDLMGHTGAQRSGIFALRGAPIQVNYLGYPGTSGAAYMDYLIADAAVIPVGEEGAYSEQVVRLRHCFLPTDDRRAIAGGTPSRAAVGLPASGFVFCAFNNPAKITPEIYAIWLRLLEDTPGAVLWLRADVPEARENLLRAAQAQQIDPARVIFAPALQVMESHLARYRVADLFLDTLPYNAHATACDALWAGLPVLTCRGRSFAGRVGASLLNTLGLPELVVDDLPSYERTAQDLARDPKRLQDMRARLERARARTPLFDTRAYCRRLEAAFAMMYDRSQAGLAPVGFEVDSRIG